MSPSDVVFAAARRVGLGVRDLLGRGPRGEWIFSVALALLNPRETKVPLDRREQLALLRQGFLPLSHVLYGLDEHDPAEYLTDREREHTQGLNGPAVTLLGDKVAFFFMLSHFGAPTAPVEGMLTRGEVQPFAGEPRGWLRARLGQGAPLVLKPARGGGGGGVLVLDGGPEGPRVNGEEVSWGALEGRLARLDDYVLTTFVRQAAYARRIHPSTTNTIRLLTMLDAEGAPFVAQAVHRFGSAASGPVDNWTQGGVTAGIDLETGRLGQGILFPRDGRLGRTDTHPDTRERIAGTEIPGWDGIRAGMLALAGRLRFLPYVGWDIIVTDDGHVVLEGNQYTGVHMFQVQAPLLRDPRVADFYRRHGVLKRDVGRGRSGSGRFARPSGRRPEPVPATSS